MRPSRTFISVVIIVYDRRELIHDALKSLQRQTLNKDLFEVIVVSNIDISLEGFEDLNIKFVRSNSKKGSAKYAEGIRQSSGEIIAFLDDDDTFLPEKLQRVYNLLTQWQDVVFYRNQFFETSNVDEPIVRNKSSQDLDFEIFSVSRNSTRRLFWNLKRSNLFRNTSTMCIRREFFYEARLEKLFLNDASVPDETLFLILFTLDKEVKIINDKMVLTIYRLHTASFSHYEDDMTMEMFINRRLMPTSLAIRFLKFASEIFQNFPIIQDYIKLEMGSYHLLQHLILGIKPSFEEIFSSMIFSIKRRSALILFVSIISLFFTIFLTKGLFSLVLPKLLLATFHS